ncbi:MAG: triose-phosphate isomerase [Dehalococcoidales bacterium]|nr:triose-phosphate isomerase [Dehalococcoidales bacterium]
MRIPLIAGNWKMNTTVDEATSLVKQMLDDLEKIGDVEKVVCPPFISLVPVRNLLKGTDVLLGAQNVFYEEKGAFTGEISPLMLSGICQYVIIGHSERRQYFKENGEMISKKVSAALRHNLRPILCIGENLTDYESGKTREVVTDQLLSSLSGVNRVDSITIAYEPVWAIGTGKAANGKEANETIKLIRSLIEDKYGKSAASNMRILYGGSVTSSNISEFVSQAEIDGALVGGASLKAREFVEIVKQTAEIKRDSMQ